MGKRLDLAHSTVSNLLKYAEGFGPSSARKFEKAFQLPPGYMDHLHTDAPIDTVKLAACLEKAERYLTDQQFQDLPRSKKSMLIAEFYAIYPAKISHQKLGVILAGA